MLVNLVLIEALFIVLNPSPNRHLETIVEIFCARPVYSKPSTRKRFLSRTSFEMT